MFKSTYGKIDSMATTTISTKTVRQKSRTYGRNRPHHGRQKPFIEGDAVYFMKLVAVVLLATLWIKFATPMTWNGVPLSAFPLGAFLAFVAVKLFERDTMNRKIWFAVLVVVTIISYFVPAGIVL